MFHQNFYLSVISLFFLALLFFALSLIVIYSEFFGSIFFIIYFISLTVACLFGLYFTIKYKNYFKIEKPIKWSDVKCNICNYVGKPKNFISEVTIIEYIFPVIMIIKIPKRFYNLIKFFPIEYGCPNCQNPRKNYKNIEFIKK